MPAPCPRYLTEKLAKSAKRTLFCKVQDYAADAALEYLGVEIDQESKVSLLRGFRGAEGYTPMEEPRRRPGANRTGRGMRNCAFRSKGTTRSDRQGPGISIQPGPPFRWKGARRYGACGGQAFVYGHDLDNRPPADLFPG
jgi:hypothetical protein